MPIALDWRKCLLGGIGVALFVIGLETTMAGASLGRWHLLDLPELLAGLRLAQREDLLGLLAALAVAATWGLYIFSFLGGAIARLAAIEFSTGRRAPISEGLRFAQQKFRAYFWSPAGVLLLAGLFGLLSVAGGLIGRFGLLGIGPTLVALLHLFSLLMSVVLVSLLVGVSCAWGLMFGAVAVERTDNFDAVSRSLNYFYTRPWRALAYRALGWGYGSVACSVVLLFAGLIWGASHLAVGLGMGDAHQQMTGLLPALLRGQASSARIGLDSVIYATVGVGYLCLVAGYFVSYLFSSQVIQYLLLRLHVEGTGISEITLEESAQQDNLALNEFLYDTEMDDEQPALEEQQRDPEGISAAH